MASDPPPPPRSSDGLQVPAPASASATTGESSWRGAARGLSPADASRRPASINPATPGAVEETASEYFPTLATTSSARSRSTSRAPSLRPPFSNTPSYASYGSYADRPTLEDRRQPSIRIRRSSNASLRRAPPSASTISRTDFADDGLQGGRPRSISQPERARVAADPALGRHSRRQLPQVAMPRLTEEGARPTMAELGVPASPITPVRSLPEEGTFGDGGEQDLQPDRKRLQRRRKMSRLFGRRQSTAAGEEYSEQELADQRAEEEYDTQLVDWLDTIDPEVQTLSTLTNVQNSLFVPDLGSWLNRRPTYNLSQHDAQQMEPRPVRRASEIPEQPEAEAEAQAEDAPPPMERSNTITSRLTDSHYAALPHGTVLQGWSADEKWELDDHVRHMLHSRRARFKRQLKGFGQYVRRPLGFFVTLYATLITLFGLAWVLFLIGWIYVGEKQIYAVHVIDSILVALFAVMGDGLAPFRAVDTYHLIFVVRYSRMIEKYKKNGLGRPRSRLQKRNVPPEVRESMEQSALESLERSQTAEAPGGLFNTHDGETTVDWTARRGENGNGGVADLDVDPEDAKSSHFDPNDMEDSPLTFAQWKSLEHHKKKLAKSHSFYKPRETFTHNPFPLSFLIAIVVLLDCHSCLQISLGACTWGIDYHTRPFALTTVILCVSITCNITAGLVITIGDRRTRKKDVVNLLDRQELTGDAIRQIEKQRKKEHLERGEPIPDIPEVNLDALKEENGGLDPNDCPPKPKDHVHSQHQVENEKIESEHK